MPWVPHSPDLSPLDFFLKGFVKDRVYEYTSSTLDELTIEISRIVKIIPLTVCKKSIENFVRRIAVCSLMVVALWKPSEMNKKVIQPRI